jgi:hypothetical protein
MFHFRLSAILLVSVEPETVVEEPEKEVTDETVIEDETPVIEETTGE